MFDQTIFKVLHPWPIKLAVVCRDSRVVSSVALGSKVVSNVLQYWVQPSARRTNFKRLLCRITVRDSFQLSRVLSNCVFSQSFWRCLVCHYRLVTAAHVRYYLPDHLLSVLRLTYGFHLVGASFL